jgi:hypothetical protein
MAKAQIAQSNKPFSFLDLDKELSKIEGFELGSLLANNSFSEVSMVMDYYRAIYGYQSTFEDIQQYTYMYTVTTSKVPEEYSISYDKTIMSSNLVSSTIRVASEESTGYSECQGSLMYLRACKENDCWECTYINERSGSRERMCVLLVKSYHVDCVKVN